MARRLYDCSTGASGPTERWIQRYRQLTTHTLPVMARQSHVDWPVKEDHCFQRIVLDNVFEGAWYEYLNAPAYKHMSCDQAKAAVSLCEAILTGERNLQELNRNSLRWRSKQTAFKFYR